MRSTAIQVRDQEKDKNTEQDGKRQGKTRCIHSNISGAPHRAFHELAYNKFIYGSAVEGLCQTAISGSE